MFKSLWFNKRYPVLKNRKKISYGKNTFFAEHTIVNADGDCIEIGDNCTFEIGVYLRLWGGKIKIGDNLFVGPYSIIYGHGGVVIGNNVLIASHVTIIPANHNFKNKTRPVVQQGLSMKGIVIKDGAWIASGAVILDGVTIGENAVVAAGAVVTKDVAPNCVVAGIPARLISSNE